MEAMRALAKIPTARSAELVLAATEKPMDEFLDYAVWLSINDLAEPWIASIKSGEWKPEGNEKQLAFGLTCDSCPNSPPRSSLLPQGHLPVMARSLDRIDRQSRQPRPNSHACSIKRCPTAFD